VQHNFVSVRNDRELFVLGYSYAAGSTDPQLDRAAIGAGSNPIVKFNALLIAVINKIDVRIETVELDLAVKRRHFFGSLPMK
jgi:hypothetical protein